MKTKINIDEETLIKLYLTDNKTIDEVAEELKTSSATVNRFLKKFNIKKSKELRRQAISRTKQSKSEEEKLEYSQHISEARKGKGKGQIPWNKGKHVGNGWLGKHHSEKTKKKISETKQNKSAEEKAEIERKRRLSRSYENPWNKGIKTGAWTDEQKATILAKQYETKKRNKSFNSSKPEDRYYIHLIDIYGEDDVVRQYRDDRYPYACDFYVKSKDLFIELNFNWTHGGHPFDSQNEADIKKLAIWEEKAAKSEFYKNAIYTWTELDVKKQLVAKENKLNYIVYYSEEDAYND